MTNDSLQRLDHLLNTIPAMLRAIPEDEFNARPADAWSKKEILGHLLDSAANNHQRFIRGQFEIDPHIVYDADNWVAASRYQDMPAEHVIAFWTLYNRHLMEVASRIPEETLQRTCQTGEAIPVTIEWLVDDYVKHLEHHLHQIVAY